MYLSDDMSEQELLDTAAEQRHLETLRAAQDGRTPDLRRVLNATLAGLVQRRESGLYVVRSFR